MQRHVRLGSAVRCRRSCSSASPPQAQAAKCHCTARRALEHVRPAAGLCCVSLQEADGQREGTRGAGRCCAVANACLQQICQRNALVRATDNVPRQLIAARAHAWMPRQPSTAAYLHHSLHGCIACRARNRQDADRACRKQVSWVMVVDLAGHKQRCRTSWRRRLNSAKADEETSRQSWPA